MPTGTALVALIMGAAVIYPHARIGSGWLEHLAWNQSSSPLIRLAKPMTGASRAERRS